MASFSASEILPSLSVSNFSMNLAFISALRASNLAFCSSVSSGRGPIGQGAPQWGRRGPFLPQRGPFGPRLANSALMASFSASESLPSLSASNFSSILASKAALRASNLAFISAFCSSVSSGRGPWGQCILQQGFTGAHSGFCGQSWAMRGMAANSAIRRVFFMVMCFLWF